MKLVIDIPDDIYRNKNYADFFGCYTETLDATIESGTPLNKIRDSIDNMSDDSVVHSKLEDFIDHRLGMDDFINEIGDFYRMEISEIIEKCLMSE